MTMIKKILMLCLVSTVFSSFAASVQDQISAIAAAESAAKAEAKQRQDAEGDKWQQQQKTEQARRAKAAAAKKAERERTLAEKKADKKRDQDFVDQLRQLEIQRQKLAIERESARMKRENEFIDQELNQSKATTDVIQPHADANHLSEGDKSLESAAKAEDEKAESKSWFGKLLQ